MQTVAKDFFLSKGTIVFGNKFKVIINLIIRIKKNKTKNENPHFVYEVQFDNCLGNWHCLCLSKILMEAY